MTQEIPNVLRDMLPDPEQILEMEPWEVAGPLLKWLTTEPARQRGALNRASFHHTPPYGLPLEACPKDVGRVLIQAWMWLEREGFLAPEVGGYTGEVFVTRRGRAAAAEEDWRAYRMPEMLDRRALHPIIQERAWPLYRRGDYDTAVFEAYKQVEVAVRDAAQLGNADYGVKLMYKAFRSEDGPLTDVAALDSEQQAMMQLFAGAIGVYKNPSSHVNVAFSDPIYAAHVIVLASLLLQTVDQRRGSTSDEGTG